MSSSFGLVKFNRTGNIYYCCYNGTSDVMIPYLCTPEVCYDKEADCYDAITYCRKLSSQHKSWKFPDDITDLDDIEIYANYGGGFCWKSTGSESVKMIKDYLMPYEQCWEDMEDGRPDWVEEFLQYLENK